ncbi:hypothetical protein [Marinobacter sp. SS8-8]|uniref:hypothetical protein n=1 Tax=Marinobacter sp. SS8-8 TaxID=3050452 RepID=UPI0026DED8A3|nr:hypothetical protein [Marinobacter sp. SS8-8]|tara:strand:+ start:29742 stop:29894 length:153 start_codon:yes stop_codon:yes gene_type:complete
MNFYHSTHRHYPEIDRIVQHGAMLKAHVVNTTSQYNLPPNKVKAPRPGDT